MPVAKYAMPTVLALSCLVTIITAIVAMNCAANKNKTCAQEAGFTALVMGLAVCSACVSLYYANKHVGRMGSGGGMIGPMGPV
jgi:hypothetical protein